MIPNSNSPIFGFAVRLPAWLASHWTKSTKRRKKKSPFADLPIEIVWQIFAFATQSAEGYASLSRVSRRVRARAQKSYFPHNPIILTTPRHFKSFLHLVSNQPNFGASVRYLWVVPPRTADYDSECAAIIDACPNITHLASIMHPILRSIARDHGKFRHTRCTALSIVGGSASLFYFSTTVNGCLLLSQLTHFRIAQQILGPLPESARFPNLTHLSVAGLPAPCYTPGSPNPGWYAGLYPAMERMATWAFSDEACFPNLRYVVLTKRPRAELSIAPSTNSPSAGTRNLCIIYWKERTEEKAAWIDTVRGGSGLWEP